MTLKNIVCAAVFSLLALTSFSVAHAGEPLFGYVYTTDTTPAEKWELEQWVTDREGQANGHFHHFHFNTEFEYGVTDRFQIATYLNLMYDNDNANSVRGKTEGIEIPYDHDPNTSYSALRFDSISFEFLYRFLSPYTDPVGLALYLEPEIGPRDEEIEFRLILQKDFLDDQLVLAFNNWVSFESEKGSNLVPPGSDEIPDGAFDQATMWETDIGASYRIAAGWFVGLEFRNHNEYSGWTLSHGNQDHTAFFLGPNIHYASEKWFFTLSVLKQIAAIGYKDDQRADMQGGLLYGDEHTSWDGIRLKVGFPF